MPTLHEELTAILNAGENSWQSLDDLAAAVNRRGNYSKGDGSPVEAGQIHLRTRTGGSYEWLFERNGRLVRLREGGQAIPRTSSLVRTSAARSAPAIPQTSESADAALLGPGVGFEEAQSRVPRSPGLYAIYGEPHVWEELGLGRPPDGRPLYVGKAEQSLAARDIRQHFEDGRTGSSTVRRSFAALFREALGLRGIPRNTLKPGYYANYGLSPDDDRKLTAWMRANLTIASWSPPEVVDLARAEREIVLGWEPPLNLTHVNTRWTGRLSAARAVMAEDARNWRPSDARRR